MRRTTFAGAGLLAMLLPFLGCSKPQQGGGFSMPPTPVETAAVVRAPVVDRFEAVGTIEAENSITVVAEIDAVVVSIPFQEGQQVEKGALLAQLDDAQLQAEVDRAEALRQQGQVTYERIKTVVEQAAGAPQALDDAAATLKVAEANLALAKARLAKTRIVAPFGGIVGARRVSPGAFLRAGSAITDLAEVRELRVNFSAPERYLALLVPGASVTVSTPAYPGYALQGHISVVEPVLDPVTRSARIVALVDNPGGKLRPGMSANVSAVLSRRADALTIPNEAVFVDGSQPYVFVVKSDSTVTKTAVTLGTRQPDVVEVLSGLSDDMSVVRAGHQKLYEGAKILPVPAEAGAAGAGAAAAGSAAEAGAAGANAAEGASR